jgi:hypothetical protein
VTGENLIRHRATKFAHLSLKHISHIGVVRIKMRDKRKTKKKVCLSENARLPSSSSSTASKTVFISDEADDADEDDEDDEDDDDDDDDDDENLRGMSESEDDSDSDDDAAAVALPTDDSGDLSEMLVTEAENLPAAAAVHSAQLDHSYSVSFTIGNRKRKAADPNLSGKKKAHYRYSFLYSMVSSGVTKKIRNCIPKAVAILSNSKTIILGHVNFLLECLDPRLAELCYMDTDSCIFSFTHPDLEDNLLSDMRDKWLANNIIADEKGESSCHGKLKLEGTFRVGLFKALKIYRLFNSRQFKEEQTKKICYTRCKGVNRNIAKIIPNSVFDKSAADKVVVHRSCLRPSRTGEMLIAHECKSLAAPFNLKRHVTDDGIHTFPISYLAAGEEEAEETIDSEEVQHGTTGSSF